LPIQSIRHNQILIPGAVQYRRLLSRHLAQADADLQITTIDLSNCQQIFAHKPEDQVISVGTGMMLSSLAAYLAQFEQWLPISYSDDRATLGDAIITGDGGPLEHFSGGLRRLVLGLTIALSDGRKIRTGGQVVKNVTGYDTTKIFIGTHGYLGVPVAANLRLFALPQAFRTNVFIANEPAILLALGASLISSNLPLVCLDLVSFPLLSIKLGHDFSRHGNFGLLVRLAGRPEVLESVDASITQIGKRFPTTLVRIHDMARDSDLWRSVAALSNDEQLNFMDVSLSRKLADKLFPQLLSVAFGIDYRIAFGRFRIFTYDLSAFASLVDTLSDLATREDEPIAVSYPSESGTLRVLRLASDAQVEVQILRQLKRELDPAGLLCPFLDFG